MYIFQNSLKNIGRNKDRNILIATIIFIIIVASCTALVIKNTSNGVINDYKNRFGSVVHISPNFNIGMKTGKVPPTLTSEQQIKIAKSKYMKEVSGEVTDPAVSKSLKAVDQDADQSDAGIVMSSDGKAADPRFIPKMKVFGVSSLKKLPEFQSGQRQIIDGEYDDKLNGAIVSQEFAKLNHLTVGSKISLESVFLGDVPDDQQIKYDLTVTGIYADAKPAYPEDFPFKDPMLNNRNDIITSFDTVMKAYGKHMPIEMTLNYVLTSPSVMDDFKREIASYGVTSDKFNITADIDSYNKIVKPVEGMKSFANTFLIIVLILGSIILVLLSVIAMRERKYEVGVLRAMGMKKGKVAIGFLTEVIVITALCLAIAIPVSGVVAQPISNSMLKSQNEAIKEQDSANQTNSMNGMVIVSNGQNQDQNSSTKTIDSINTKINSETIWQIIIVALILAGISSSVSVYYISRFEPIKILSNRN
ncbi:ABC transporter permease [Neobacillus sp. WH10]|uniref:ABC transporter permease n=1 Tax=Neobacillus sp. WH10 TaxID=3047873 RepID=UPI0024C17BC2|nr:ABC transporter permease [Neobacillus sp. WH10]WHY79760.1 ABC transporter permease [Neobacillus sp. WH10]